MTYRRTSILRRVQAHAPLPTLPVIMQRILETVEDESSSAADLTRIIESDPVITARVLRLANSAFIGHRHAVESLQRAVVVIGFDMVKHMALSATVLNAMQRLQQRVLDPRDFWLHSLGAARAAQLLALESGHVHQAPACFTAALLHDLGKYMLALTLGEEYQQLAAYALSNELRLKDVEQLQLGVDHAEVGGLLLEHWGLPPVLCEAVIHQYSPDTYTGPFQLEVAVVAAASEISRVAGFGTAGDLGPLRLPPISLDASGLTAEAIQKTLEILPALRDEAVDLLHMLREEQGAA